MKRSPGRTGPRAAATLAALLLTAGPGLAADPSGEEIARRVRDRPSADHATRTVVLELHDGEGRVRERRMRNFWKLGPDAKRLVFAVQEPPELEHDAFLAVDWFDSSRDDDQWIYRRQRKRAERIGMPKRGQPFLGSDFSLEDIKKEDRVELDEYRWKSLGREPLDGQPHLLLEQVPVRPELAESLGFARAVSHVDPVRWLRRRVRFYDAAGALLKQIDVGDLQRDGEVWWPRTIQSRSADGHRSVFRIVTRDTRTPVPDELFTVRALERERLGSARGLPAPE